MARRDPLLPNAAIVARREYRDRLRSPLFVVSTIVLMGIAVMVALAPIGIRYLDRQTVTHIAVVADDPALAGRAVTVTDSLLNVPPVGVDPAAWEKAFVVEPATAADAEAALAAGDLGGILFVTRGSDGRLDVVYRNDGPSDGVRSQLVGFAAIAMGILDWTATLPADSQLDPFQTPSFREEVTGGSGGGTTSLDPQEVASRAFLGIVFVVLLFLTVIIYGMWVATGVAAEKSSRVMELMISAASPRQLLTGKVVGIGAAGLTQYLAVAVPALIIVAFQDRIAAAVLGPGWAAGAPLVGLTPELLAGYGVFFLLGFALFALIYAAMGSFVSRPEDLQTLSLPLSLVAMAGYLMAVAALTGGAGRWVALASFVPPFSPFVMVARMMGGGVPVEEIVLSIAILVVVIAGTAVVAARLYAAGVLLYGQRPGLRQFLAAARRVSAG